MTKEIDPVKISCFNAAMVYAEKHKVGMEVDDILAVAEKFSKWLLDGADEAPAKPANDPKSNVVKLVRDEDN